MNNIYLHIFSFISSAIGTNTQAEGNYRNCDWPSILKLAIAHGIHAVVFDGISNLPKETQPETQLLMKFFGYVNQLEIQNERQQLVATKISELCTKAETEATVLKGRSIAQYYPNPRHRYSCDLDLFIEAGWDRTCKLLEEDGVQLEHEVYKEVEFTMDGVYVECHRYITPLRGHKNLQRFEKYLRMLLKGEKQYFPGTTLINPPLMFTVMLFIEHALGDFLHGKLTLKHIADWMVLRKQNVDWIEFHSRCDEFKFTRFANLIDALADVVEGKTEYESLPNSYKNALDEVLTLSPSASTSQSWFARRVLLFFDILKNSRKFRQFGYCSMSNYLFNSVWTHFFKREVEI